MNNLEKYNKVFCDVMQDGQEKLASLKFKESEYWDSIGHMTLIAALEEEFDIMLETEDMMAGESAVWHLESVPDADAALLCSKTIRKA